jgi:hypothetical protein
VISRHNKQGNAADEGSSSFVGVDIAVPNWEPEITIASFRSEAIDIVAGVQCKVRLGQRGLAGKLEMVGVEHQMDNAALEIGKPWRIGSRNGGEESFVSLD